jgi:hypothetical protein
MITAQHMCTPLVLGWRLYGTFAARMALWNLGKLWMLQGRDRPYQGSLNH